MQSQEERKDIYSQTMMILTTVLIDTIARKVVGSGSNGRAEATECLLQTAPGFYTSPQIAIDVGSAIWKK